METIPGDILEYGSVNDDVIINSPAWLDQAESCIMPDYKCVDLVYLNSVLCVIFR